MGLEINYSSNPLTYQRTIDIALLVAINVNGKPCPQTDINTLRQSIQFNIGREMYLILVRETFGINLNVLIPYYHH